MAQSMTFDISANDRASASFLKLAENVEKLEDKLKSLDRLRVKPTVRVDMGDSQAEVKDLRRELDQIRNVNARVKVGVTGATAVNNLNTKINQLRDANINVDVRVGDAETKADRLATKLTALKALSPLKLRVELDDDATPGLAAVRAAADALAAARPTVTVDADTAAAAAQLAALTAQLAALGANATTVNVRLDTPTFLGELARVQTQLNTLAGGTIEIDADTRRLMTALATARTELAALNAMEASPTVDADTELARFRIRELEQELARIAGRQYTAKVDVDKDGAGAAKLMGLVAASGMAVAGFGSLTASAATLAGSLASLVGLAPLFVGGLAAGGAAAATLKVGLKGVGDALKETDPTKFAEALKGLAPAAREFARSVRDIGPAWKDLQLDTQQRLFAGLGAEMQKLSGAYLPSLKSGMGGVADQFNLLGKDMVGFATSTKTIGDVDAIFRNTTRSLEAARPAAVNLAAAFTDIAVVGTSMLPELAAGFTNVTGRFRDFIAEARQSGQLQQWIQGGLDTLQQLGSVAGNVGSILGSVFTAAKASGADFLTTLDRVTEGVATFMRSGQGQNAMVTFFTESRAAIDALLPGLETLGRAAAQAVEAFSNTGGLQDAGAAFTDIADAVAPLIPALAELAGGALSALAAGASAAASALTPIVDGVVGLLGALGPVAPAVLGMIVAFKGLGFASAAVATLGVHMATLAVNAGAGAATYTRITGAFAAAGRAIPILGAAVVGLAFAYDGLTTSTSEAVDIMSQGGAASRNLLKELQAQEQGVNSNASALEKWAEPFDEWTKTNILGIATVKNVTAAWEAQRAEMSAVERAQQDLTTAQDAYDEALNKFPPSSVQVQNAAAALADAHQNLADANDDAGAAAQSHTDKLVAQADAMRSQVGAALAYEEAVRRTAESHKAAQKALDESGASSEAYQTAVRDLARDIDAQATSAAAQAEALGGAEAGAKAYATEILRASDVSTGPGRDAFIKMASAMDTAGLAALSSAAQMSGLKTEIVTLPDGRTVQVVVASETSKLKEVGAELNALAASKFVGTVTIVGDGVPFRDGVMAAVTFANGQRGFVTLDGDDKPIRAKIGNTKYTIDATTGIITIDGNPGPGDTNLSGLKLRVDSTTGVMTLDADGAPAKNKTDVAVAYANGSKGTLTLDGDPTLVNGKTQQAVVFADGSKGTITIDGNPDPATGQVTATIRYADGSTGTVKVDADAVAANAAIDNAARDRSSTITVTYAYRNQAQQTSHLSQGGKGGAGGGLVGYTRAAPVRMARGGVIAGYQPGVDTVPAILSRGEAVLVPELVRAIGPRNILAANKAASGREPTMWSGGGLARFAAGGVVKHGTVSDAKWQGLKAQGWKGRAGDGMEALYAPGSSGGGPSSFKALDMTIGWSGFAGGGLAPRRTTTSSRLAQSGIEATGLSPRIPTAAPSGTAGSLLTQVRGSTGIPLHSRPAAQLSTANLEKKVDEMVGLLRDRLGVSITVEDRSGDPTETARATMLALRMAR